MDDFPRTVAEFEARFATEDACRAYLCRLRWPDGFRCRCGDTNAWWTARGLWQCTACGAQTSITAGTVFQDTRKPLRLWFHAMWWVASQKTGGTSGATASGRGAVAVTSVKGIANFRHYRRL